LKKRKVERKRDKEKEKRKRKKKKEKERKRKRQKAAGKKMKFVVFPILERNSPGAMGLTALCVGSAYFATSETVRKYVQGATNSFFYHYNQKLKQIM
jgi:hypothetical protein